MWKNHDLEKSYEVVIIGAGAHGLATAYYLTKLGISNIAVLEQKFIGYGGSGRNTAILRSNYRTEEGIKFYDQSLKLYENLAGELNYNLMSVSRGTSLWVTLQLQCPVWLQELKTTRHLESTAIFLSQKRLKRCFQRSTFPIILDFL